MSLSTPFPPLPSHQRSRARLENKNMNIFPSENPLSFLDPRFQFHFAVFLTESTYIQLLAWIWMTYWTYFSHVQFTTIGGDIDLTFVFFFHSEILIIGDKGLPNIGLHNIWNGLLKKSSKKFIQIHVDPILIDAEKIQRTVV